MQEIVEYSKGDTNIFELEPEYNWSSIEWFMHVI